MRTKEVYQCDVDAIIHFIYGQIAHIQNDLSRGVAKEVFENKMTATQLNIAEHEAKTRISYFRELAQRLERGVINE